MCKAKKINQSEIYQMSLNDLEAILTNQDYSTDSVLLSAVRAQIISLKIDEELRRLNKLTFKI